LNEIGYRPEDQQKFWARVTRCSHGEHCSRCCWLWKPTSGKHGYGAFRLVLHRYIFLESAHRYAYQVSHGPLLPGVFVLHRCDVRACVNPAHLWAGTHSDNMADKRKKGRGRTKAHDPELTDEHVRDIRYLRSVGMPRPLVSAIYQLHPDTVTRIVKRRRRGNVA
jgi:hypothetical protein